MASPKTMVKRDEEDMRSIIPREAIAKGNMRYLPVSHGFDVYRASPRTGSWRKVGHVKDIPEE